VITRQMGPGMIQQTQAPCDKCNGIGEIVKDEDKCKQCKGKKVIKETKILEVQIEPGMRPGQKISFFGESDEAPGAETGDIVVVLGDKPSKEGDEDDSDKQKDKDKEDSKEIKKTDSKKRKNDKLASLEAELKGIKRPKFQRLKNGVDLVFEHKLSLAEALLGFDIPIKHLDDRVLVVKSPPLYVTNSDDVLCIEGEGMPVHKQPDKKGDLFVKLSVVMPKPEELKDPNVRNALEKILPPAPKLPTAVKAATEMTGEGRIDSLVAKPYGIEQAKAKAKLRAESGADQYDDDEEGNGRGQAASCATQ